jgi:hypothetical protein
MAAGAAAVAAHARDVSVSPELIERAFATAERSKALCHWQSEGKCHIEQVIRPHTNMRIGRTFREVSVGGLKFSEPDVEQVGGWPSELLFAQIALAVTAGQWKKEG